MHSVLFKLESEKQLRLATEGGAKRKNLDEWEKYKYRHRIGPVK